jgi:hypothetical protein
MHCIEQAASLPERTRMRDNVAFTGSAVIQSKKAAWLKTHLSIFHGSQETRASP